MSATYTKIICKPLNDRNKRFLLGNQGKVEMLAIGLNPSKANEEKLAYRPFRYAPAHHLNA
jgi:hypothetical protein